MRQCQAAKLPLQLHVRVSGQHFMPQAICIDLVIKRGSRINGSGFDKSPFVYLYFLFFLYRIHSVPERISKAGLQPIARKTSLVGPRNKIKNTFYFLSLNPRTKKSFEHIYKAFYCIIHQ